MNILIIVSKILDIDRYFYNEKQKNWILIDFDIYF